MTTRPISCQKRRSERKEPRGFSLITTVTILVLLSLIAIGLLSLSAVTVRSGRSELAQLEAKANARMALMIAIGELQKYMGPDQRISAPAAVLDDNPETPEIEDVEHPYWTVAWSTLWEGPNGDEDNVTPWVRNDNEGGLSDRRFEDGFDREREVLAYLVSGNEGGKKNNDEYLDARDATLQPEEQIIMVGEGTLGAQEGGSDDDGWVVAKRIPTIKNGQERGAYAYWIGDDGVKANLAAVDPYYEDKPRPGDDPEGMERLVTAQDAAEEQVENIGKIDEVDGKKIFTVQSLAVPQGVSKEGVQENYHEVTAHSSSVLANVRQGNLQRDLTAYLYDGRGSIRDLESGGDIVSWGIDDLDKMVGPANAAAAKEQGTRWQQTKYRDIAPTFALIRKWHRLGQRLGFSESSREWEAPRPTKEGSDLRGHNDGVNVYDGANLTPVGFLPHDEINVAPVMVEGSMYYNLASVPTSPGNPRSQYRLRLCMYPRVALWNPYNVELETGPLVASMFLNGNKEIQLKFPRGADRQASIPFGRGSVNIGVDGRCLNKAASSSGPDPSPGHYVGWLNFMIQGVTLAPGETQMFFPMRAQEYTIQAISRNTLSSAVAPDPSNYFYQDMNVTLQEPPNEFIEFPLGGVGSNASGGDNYMMCLKNAEGDPRVMDRSGQGYNTLPLVAYYNCSLQAGGSDELPVRWNSAAPAQVHTLQSGNDRLGPGAIPDVRTRDGFRIRWWNETESNKAGSGVLRRQPSHLQTAAIANWNPRGAYFCRTPWDNVTDQPPHFYGMYTRDLFDQEVSWDALMPRIKNGKMLGYPFGPPLDGPDEVVLFDLPRTEVGIPSIGYLRHVKMSEFGWHPSYAIGNSIADPRVGRKTTSPVLRSSQERSRNGWNQHLFGFRDGRADYWAQLHREIVFNRPDDHFLVYDLSYELNFNLWDNFFVSTGSPGRKDDFFEDPLENPLPNGRMTLYRTGSNVEDDIQDFHRAASQLMLKGGFNVHSTSKEAWKAILASTADTGYGSAIPFPRLLNPPRGEWLDALAEDETATGGYRSISDYDLEALAEEIVREVKERAPFFGLADFINRRLVDGKHGEAGPIEAAIKAAGLNKAFDDAYPIQNQRDLPQVSFMGMSDSTRLDQTLKPNSTAWGIPGYLTQGDIVQVIGSTLTARSDTFTVRAYGESVDNNGAVKARAWCEAIVQRTPEPIDPDEFGLNPVARDDKEFDFGRRFRMVSFRWMAPEEV